MSRVEKQFDAGIMVTASHNPWTYNGIKIKDAQGSSADQTVTQKVESLMDQSSVRKASPNDVRGSIKNILDDYVAGIKGYLDMGLFKKKPLKILVDSMHGAGNRHIEMLLEGTAVQVTTLRGEKSASFNNPAPEPIPKHFPETSKEMQNGPYDAAFATDGDADRIGAIRPGGEFVSPDQMLANAKFRYNPSPTLALIFAFLLPPSILPVSDSHVFIISLIRSLVDCSTGYVLSKL